jgi:hypothetical protein
VIGHWGEDAHPEAMPPQPELEAWTINGKSWPDTERLTYSMGQTIRWRWINASYEPHPLHLHGHYFMVDSEGDGDRSRTLAGDHRPKAATTVVPSGSTLALSWTPLHAGNWLFHCHILFHVDPTLRLTPGTAPGSADPAHADHDPARHMAGLVLGVHVVEEPVARPMTAAAQPRRLRLTVGERPVRFGDAPGLGYDLREDSSTSQAGTPEFTAPGPVIVLTRGQPVEIAVENRLKQSTSVHWHGIELESYYDGVLRVHRGSARSDAAIGGVGGAQDPGLDRTVAIKIVGFPAQDDLAANSAVLTNTHLVSPSITNSARISFFRFEFLFDQRLNRTSPRELGFDYDSASALGQGPPFFNVIGYSPIGGAQVGPRTSAQNTYEAADSVSWFRGSHSLKFGGGFRRNQINVFQATVPNGLFIFTPFPASDAFANLLLGAPQIFFLGAHETYRGLRNWGATLYTQDEWRLGRTLTVNYGVRWEAVNPNSEIRNRLNGFVPGLQSKIRPDAPEGLVFPGDPGVGTRIEKDYYKAFMPRVGVAWDPTGRGAWSIRAGYGIFYDPFANGPNLGATNAVSSAPWATGGCAVSDNVNFQSPCTGSSPPVPNTFARPLTILAMDPTARPPYAQDWNFSIQRSLHKDYVLETRYVGTKGTRLPRTVELNPSAYGPGATSANADRRRIYGDCPPDGSPCGLATAATLFYGTNSAYHAAQVSLAHRYAVGLAFNVSYWYSKSIDNQSGINLNLASAQTLSGENDLAQNPFDLRSERGLSLFDARHRFVASGLWELPFARTKTGLARTLWHGWQMNGVMTANTGTPFTVYDAENVALQALSPPISGYPASRPDLIGDPNSGAWTVESWMSRTAFRRLVAATEAGKFGNAGRNIARAGACQRGSFFAERFQVD